MTGYNNQTLQADGNWVLHEFRGVRVILDSDLAEVFGAETKRLNEQVKRNADRFGAEYAFQLSEAEFAALRSRMAASNPGGRGGRRYPPWVFTEYGVVMVATVLDSDRAVAASRKIVEAFVAGRRMAGESFGGLPAVAGDDQAGLSQTLKLVAPKLRLALDHLLDTVVNPIEQKTAREEVQQLISESISHLHERLKRHGVENDKIAAEATKLLAQAEKERAIAAKNRAEVEAIKFTNTVRRLKLLIEVEQALSKDDPQAFIAVLGEFGGR